MPTPNVSDCGKPIELPFERELIDSVALRF